MSKLIPFSLMPGSWGLKGKVRDEAEAYYNLSGEELDRRLNVINGRTAPRYDLDIDLKYGRLNEYEYDKKVAILNTSGSTSTCMDAELLRVEFKHGILTEYDYDKKVAETLNDAGQKRDIAMLAVEFKHRKISEIEYEKGVATAEERPWIKVVNDGFDADGDHPSFRMEFDWNPFFVEYLTINGYIGATEEDIVERWFQELCRATVEESEEVQFQFGI